LTSDAGFGHRRAAQAIATALERTYHDGCRVDLVNPMQDKSVPSLLQKREGNYTEMVKDSPELYKLSYEAFDTSVVGTVVEGIMIAALYKAMHGIIKDLKPDVVVSTYHVYHAPLKAVLAVKAWQIPFITVVTDLVTLHQLWFTKAADLCLVPTEAARELALSHGLAPEQVRITGIPVDPDIAEEHRKPAQLRAELGLRSDLKTLLVVSSARTRNVTEILRTLNHSGLPIQLVLIAGGDDELYRHFEDTDWHVPAHVYNFVQDMPAFLQAADVILCKAGGLIVTEALASGLPILLIDVIAGQETGNAEYVVEGGAGELAEDPVTALETLNHWLADGGALLAERAENARRLGRPRAAFEVARAVWAAPESYQRKDRSEERSRLTELLDRHKVPWQEDLS
jgi:1,2-diacylglycerol 3-beta-galactosyltransferase